MILFFFFIFMTAGQNAYASSSRIDITVSCEWDDEEDRDGTRPDQVTVTLYANGSETGRAITLNQDNSWSGCFYGCDTYRYGQRLSYSIIEERVPGYTGTIEGSDLSGYKVINIHQPLPEGKGSLEEITPKVSVSGEKGVIVETVVTTKVSKSKPARTSTTTQKSRSAKTADMSKPVLWELLMLASCAALYIWMRFEQGREQ